MLIRKYDIRKVRTSSIKSPSTIFSCSKGAMYNRVNRAKKQCLMLNSYLHGMNTSIFLNRHYNNIFSGKLVYELHDWIENHPNILKPPQCLRLIICQN